MSVHEEAELVPVEGRAVAPSAVDHFLDQVRPHWRAKNLMERVRRLLPVDASSACQRLFNAAIHDLREKIVVAGVDIASAAARDNRLPPVGRAEDVERYPTAKLIDLAHRMGLLTRPEWRRLSRCYEIRRDLEHEDDEYEAGVEDLVYIFKTCIEVVLSRDPVQLLRIEEVREAVQQPAATYPSEALRQDYERAPNPRQEEIGRMLISLALDEEQSDVVRQNAVTSLRALAPLTKTPVTLQLVKFFQGKVGREVLTREQARIAVAAGVFPYLNEATRVDFYERFLEKMEEVGTHWSGHQKHGSLLRSFKEVGGLRFCPARVRIPILKWLVLTYMGTPGGRTSWGNIRHVFYSNTAAPLIKELIKDAKNQVSSDLRELRDDPDVQYLLDNQHIARRYEALVDLVDEEESAA